MGRMSLGGRGGRESRRRVRVDPPREGEVGPPPSAKVALTVKVREEFRRKLVTYCSWHGINPGDLVARLVEPTLRQMRISDYSGGAGPEAEAGADPPVDELLDRGPGRNGHH